ncbi:hypothetical protein C5167_008653 [Papaver somniferum]|uniref:Uncharacterized protein n=1 Tax=Papaver somniferum TaxID=3469 RepID=A0A4Y7JV64_PAPSO|nr:hypothetical protein C5167_008653 [Papaver somniferum]
MACCHSLALLNGEEDRCGHFFNTVILMIFVSAESFNAKVTFQR